MVRGCPSVSENPQAGGLKPRPAGAPVADEREGQSSAAAAGPSGAQKTEASALLPSVRGGAAAGESGSVEKRDERCFGHRPDTHSTAELAREKAGSWL